MGEFYTRSPVYARAMPRLAWAALAASVLLAGCAPGLSFPNATAGKPLMVPAYESRPDGAGPFPACRVPTATGRAGFASAATSR
jgi:hypothetical protein